MKKAIAPALAIAIGFAAAPALHAATITVNRTADTTGGAPCTLRDAIVAANSNAEPAHRWQNTNPLERVILAPPVSDWTCGPNAKQGQFRAF